MTLIMCNFRFQFFTLLKHMTYVTVEFINYIDTEVGTRL